MSDKTAVKHLLSRCRFNDIDRRGACAVKMWMSRTNQASRNNSAASARVTGRPSRNASVSKSSTACRTAA